MSRNLRAAVLVLALAGTSPAGARADEVCLSGLEDVSLQYWPSGGQTIQAMTLLVQRQGPTGGAAGYSVRAELLGQSDFRLPGPQGATLPFQLYFADQPNVSSPGQARELHFGQALGGFGGAALDPDLGQPGDSCPPASGNASLIVVYAESDLQSVYAGTYAGALQLTIAAE